MVKNADPNAAKIEVKLDEVKVYLRWHKFKPELAGRVRRYYEFYFSRRSAMDEEQIVVNLPPALKHAVKAHLVHRTVARVPLFAKERSYVCLNLQLDVHNRLSPLLREAKEAITESLEKGCSGQARESRSIYFVRRGTIAVQGDLQDLNFFELSPFVIPTVSHESNSLCLSTL